MEAEATREALRNRQSPGHSVSYISLTGYFFVYYLSFMTVSESISLLVGLP